MIKALANWQGRVNINGKDYSSISEIPANIELTSTTVITLIPRQQIIQKSSDVEHIITVKKYMTQKSTEDFDFMLKWNEDIPMPMRTMQGTVLKETKGMVYMRLHGYAQKTITCACCGKELTNPISRAYGIGPVCLSKLGIARDIEDVSGITEDLVNIEWTGWVIKSAITEDTILNQGGIKYER